MIAAKVLNPAGKASFLEGGNFISVKQATGTLTIITDTGEQFQMQAGDTHDFDLEFKAFDVTSTTASDSIVLNVGKGTERLVGAAPGGVTSGPQATDAYSFAVGDNVITGTVATAATPTKTTLGKGGMIFTPTKTGTVSGFQINSDQGAIGARDLYTGIWYPPSSVIPYNVGHFYQLNTVDVAFVQLAPIGGGTLSFVYALSNAAPIMPVLAGLQPAPIAFESTISLLGAKTAGEIALLAAVATQSFLILSVEISTDTATHLTVHADAVESTTNIITGGEFPANGGSIYAPPFAKLLALNTPVYMKLGNNATVTVTMRYIPV